MMQFLSSPPPTRYDLRFALFGIPVRVHPLFWLMAVLFGGFAGNLLTAAVWVAAVFVSILVHELGHALAMRRFGVSSQVVLHLFGGVTVPQGLSWAGRPAYVPLSPLQEAWVSFAGPAAGFLLGGTVIVAAVAAGGRIAFGAIAGFIPIPYVLLPFQAGPLQSFLGGLLWISILWGTINLMPVYPLDGGNIARRLLVKADPWNGARTSLRISTVTGGLLAVAAFFLFRNIFLTVLFGYLAYQSYQSLRWGGGEV
jgi:stage IV sporulation protein FB